MWGGPLLTQPGTEAADCVAPSRPRAPSTIFLIKPEHVDSYHVLGAGAQSSGCVPQEQLGVLVPRQAVGSCGRGGPGRGRVAAARDPDQKQRQQREQLRPPSGAGSSEASGHGGRRRRRVGAGREKSAGDPRLRTDTAARGHARSRGSRGWRGARQSGAASQARGPSAPREPQTCGQVGSELCAAEREPARCLRRLAPRNFAAQGAAGSAGSRGGAGLGGAARSALGGTRLRTPDHWGCRLHCRAWPSAGACAHKWLRARARAQGSAPECEARSVGGVGVGERAPHTPAESRRPATEAAPVSRRRSLPGAMRGLGRFWRGARLLGCPCNGMR